MRRALTALALPPVHPGSYDAAEMAARAGEFNFPRLERVVSGIDTVDALGAELDRHAVARVVIVTGRTLGASPLLTRVRRAIGDRHIHVFAESRQHVPSCSVHDLARTLEHQQADCVISFGGGSPIDTVKAALHVRMAAGHERETSDADWPFHVAIPTTLSAGEFTAIAGVTDDKTRLKHAISDARIAPRTVIVDPTLTLETPSWLWAATGVRALDHAIESLYSIRHHPLGDAVAPRGLAAMIEHLPRSLDTQGEPLAARLQCQVAAWLCVFGITNAGIGLSHALGHQIGPRWNVPHGITSCITLPHAMRFMASVAPERFRLIADALGVPFDDANPTASALACAERTAAFIAELGMPRRLRDVDVPREDMAAVAEFVHEVMERGQVIGRPVTREQITTLLNDAY